MEKILHQIWIGPYKMPKRETACVEKVKTMQTDYEHMFWTNENLPRMPVEIQKAYDRLYAKRGYAQAANVLRLHIVNEFGGVYLDVDFEFVGGITEFNLEDYDAFLCIHNGSVDTFPNGAFGMKRKHPISTFLLNDIATCESGDLTYTPAWWGWMIKKYFGVNRDEKILHVDFAKKFLEPNNIFYVNYDNDFHPRRYFHHALYSWSDVVRKQFEEGTIE